MIHKEVLADHLRLRDIAGDHSNDAGQLPRPEGRGFPRKNDENE